MKTKFVIIGVARSGTTLLQKSIASHPAVCCVNGDVRSQLIINQGPDLFTHNNVVTSKLDKNWVWQCNFDYLFNVMGKKSDVVGFKTAFHDAEAASGFIEAVLNLDPSIKVIAAIRKDLLAIEASMQLALRLGRFHSYSSDKSKDLSIRLDPVVFSRSILRYDAALREIDKLEKRTNYLKISYEDEIMKGYHCFYPKICEFLGLSEIDPSWLDMKKQAKEPKDYLLNYDQLRVIEQITIKNKQPIPITLPYRIRRKIRWIASGLVGGRR